MNALLRALPVTALLCTVGCDVDDDTVTRVGDGVIGVGLQADIDEVELDPIDDLVSATHPTFACSEGAWTPAWITLEDQVLTLVNQKRAAGATCGGVAKPPVAALTAELPADQQPDRASAPIAAPPVAQPPDNSARNVAIIGSAVAAIVIAAVLAIALPHRRVRKLDPDEF